MSEVRGQLLAAFASKSGKPSVLTTQRSPSAAPPPRVSRRVGPTPSPGEASRASGTGTSFATTAEVQPLKVAVPLEPEPASRQPTSEGPTDSVSGKLARPAVQGTGIQEPKYP